MASSRSAGEGRASDGTMRSDAARLVIDGSESGERFGFGREAGSPRDARSSLKPVAKSNKEGQRRFRAAGMRRLKLARARAGHSKPPARRRAQLPPESSREKPPSWGGAGAPAD